MAQTTLNNGMTFGVVRAALNAMFADLYGGGPILNVQSGTAYTLALTDIGKQIDMTSSSPNTVTIPLNATVAFPIGTVIPVRQAGTGATSIAFASGVTPQLPADRSLTISTRYEKAWLEKVGTDTWAPYAN